MSIARENNAGEFQVTSKMVLSIAVPMTLAFLTTPLLGLVDVGVVGRMNDISLLGGLAIGAIIFDLLFSTFNFLRSATTGLVAQAMGANDRIEEQAIFWRSLVIAVFFGVVSILLAPLILKGGFWYMGPEDKIAGAAATYFLVRIWSAPLALINYTVLGYVLGRGEGKIGLMFQIIINGTNIVLSIWFGLYLGWGISGVAWATVVGEAAGAIIGLLFVVLRFKKLPALSVFVVFSFNSFKKLLSLNSDIMIRSFSLIFAFSLFTRTGVQMENTTLAANVILMNFLLVAGYYLDGIATAAEQLAGRAIGAKYRPAFIQTVDKTLVWSVSLALITAIVFYLFGDVLVAILTTSQAIREEADKYMIWAALTPLTGVLAFVMDGIYIGATWSRYMRNMMLISLALYLVLVWLLVPIWANHGLWLALNIFMLTRGLTLYLPINGRINRAFSPA